MENIEEFNDLVMDVKGRKEMVIAFQDLEQTKGWKEP